MTGLKIMQLPWLHQVRCMELSAGMTVSTTLRVLESTMNLTNLRLDYVVNYCAMTLPIVSLPKLVHLDLNLFKTLTPGALLLEHMVIPASCTMTLSARQIQREEIDKENTFGPIIAAISAYAQRCLAHHLPQRLHVVMTRTCFLLEATHYSHKPCFLLHINMASQDFNTIPGDMLATLLREFSKQGLSKVTHFELRISRSLSYVSGLGMFIACLPCVETLVTEKPFLLYLSSCMPPNGGNLPSRIVFPVLKTLKLHSFTPSQLCFKSDKACDLVSKYVMGRIAYGQVISVIDFTEVNFDVLPNMGFLTKANGVKVLWRQNGVSAIHEYICGTSAPQKLVVT